MSKDKITWAVIAFLLGNLTGALATVSAFGADVRELKVRMGAVETRVTSVEHDQQEFLLSQAGHPRRIP